MTDLAAADQFLSQVFRQHEGGSIVLWTLQDRRSYWYPTDDTTAVAHRATDLAEAGLDVYITCCLMDPDAEAGGGRGTASDATVFVAAWADIDVAGDGHKGTGLAPSHDAVVEVLDGMRCPPTLIINSGGGIHAWWLLDKPVVLKDDDQREKARLFVAGIQDAVRKAGGWTVDATQDLARVLRLPGTLNHKLDDPRPVEMIGGCGVRYTGRELVEAYPMGQKVGVRDRKVPREIPAEITEGNRSNAIASLAGGMRRRNLPIGTALAAAHALNAEQCDPPLDDEKVESTVAGIYKYPAGETTADVKLSPPVNGDSWVPFFEISKTGNKTFIPSRLGEHLQAEAHIRRGPDQRLWRYDKGVYRPDGEDWVKAWVRSLLGEEFRRARLDETLTWLRSEMPADGESPEDRINVANGWLEWRTGRRIDHDPATFSTNQSPVAWNPEATCPRMDKFLKEAMPEDAIDLAWEIIGYAIYSRRPIQKAVLLYGPGGSGKSKFLAVIRMLLGPGAISALTLHELAEDKFAAANLYGKQANICGDLDARAVTRSDLFKQIVGGDVIEAQWKFKDHFRFRSNAFLIFSANDHPPTADQTNAWFDRWVIIPMPVVFRGTDREDVHLEDKLRAELPGILVKAVDGLRRVMERGSFDKPLTVEVAAEEYRQTVDTVVGFFDEMCTTGAAERWNQALFFSAYVRWCEESKRHPIGRQRFMAKIEEKVPGLSKTKSHGIRWLTGIGPRPEDDGPGDNSGPGDNLSPAEGDKTADQGASEPDRGTRGTKSPSIPPTTNRRRTREEGLIDGPVVPLVPDRCTSCGKPCHPDHNPHPACDTIGTL